MSSSGDNDIKGPKLSLKAIAEEALRNTREASEQTAKVLSHPAPPTPSQPRRASSTPANAGSSLEQKVERAPARNWIAIGIALMALTALTAILVRELAGQSSTSAPVSITAPAAPSLLAETQAPTAPSVSPHAVPTDVAITPTPTPSAVVATATSSVAPPHSAPATPPSRKASSASATAKEAPASELPQAIDSPSKPSTSTNIAESAPPQAAALTPSAGAVQAAIGSVLGNARVCVAGEREPSRARITFGNSGEVSAVTVTGPAAGTPAEACIKAALSKARVAPFQKPSYSVDTTVRP